MKKLILTLIAFLFLNTENLQAFSYDRLKQGLIHGAVGSALLGVSIFSAGETLLDYGHGYYELKQEYLRYLLELETLEHAYIMTSAEKRFWAFNQALSRIPKVFWREIIAGTFTIATGILAFNQLNKAINHINAGL